MLEAAIKFHQMKIDAAINSSTLDGLNINFILVRFHLICFNLFLMYEKRKVWNIHRHTDTHTHTQTVYDVFLWHLNKIRLTAVLKNSNYNVNAASTCYQLVQRNFTTTLTFSLSISSSPSSQLSISRFFHLRLHCHVVKSKKKEREIDGTRQIKQVKENEWKIKEQERSLW